MATSFKNPPILTDDKEYESWKKEVKFWQQATDLKPEKQASAIFLTLKGEARKAIMELEPETLAVADGVTQLITKLDELYSEDINQKAFMAYECFEQYLKVQFNP